MSEVVIVELKDYKIAADTLYESFKGDDISNYLFGHIKDDVNKGKAERTYFECIVYSHILKGLVTGIWDSSGTKFETVGVWSLPESGNMEDFITYMKSGFYKLAWQVGRTGRDKIYHQLFDMLYDVEEEVLGDAGCYTVVYLGTIKEGRGKGNVKKTLQFMFENYIDKNRRLCYLECSALSNIAIYNKYGFTAVREIQLGSGDDVAKMHIMVRGVSGEQWDLLEETRIRYKYVQPV